MIEFPSLELPFNLTSLLKMRIQNSYHDSSNLADLIEEDKTFSMIIKQNLRKFSENENLKSIVCSLGWRGFRDRLTSVFISKQINNRYPLHSDMTLVDDLVQFENRYREFAISGNSRIFMLGLYIKFVWIDSGIIDNAYDKNSLLEKEVYDILSISSHKTVKLDWLILALWHLIEFLGATNVATSIKKGEDPYNELFEQLSTENKKFMMSNLLAYGHAIGEHEIFTQIKI